MDYDVAVHNARVFADSGQVPDNTTTDRYVKLLKQAGLWDSCVFFGDTARGVKKDGNQFVSKVYDLKGNADLVQVTGTAQPKYQVDGSIIHDGGDLILSAALSAGNPIRDITNKLSVFVWVKFSAITTNTFILGRHNSTYTGSPWNIMFGTNIIRTTVLSALNVTKSKFSYALTPNTWVHVGLVFDGTLTQDSVSGSLLQYVNGVQSYETKDATGNMTALPSASTSIAIGGNSQGTNIVSNGTCVALPMVYNTVLTDSQALWLYNNIRPVGV